MKQFQQSQFDNFGEESQGKTSLVLSKGKECITSFFFFRCFKSLLALEHGHDSRQ